MSLAIAFVTETYPPEVNGVAMTVGRLVGGLRAGPVIRDEHGVGPDRGDDVRGKGHRTPPRGDGDEVAVDDTDRVGEAGVHLAQRSRILGDERGDAPGLGA